MLFDQGVQIEEVELDLRVNSDIGDLPRIHHSPHRPLRATEVLPGFLDAKKPSGRSVEDACGHFHGDSLVTPLYRTLENKAFQTTQGIRNPLR